MRNTLLSLLRALYSNRILIRKGSATVANLSLLICLILLLFALRTTLIILILSLLLGYRISFEREDPDFYGDDLVTAFTASIRKIRDKVKSFLHSHDQNGQA